MKQVWILNHYALAPGGAGGTRHFSLARHLPYYGWKASIIAASTDHASGVQRLSPGETARLEDHDGVPFLWLRTRGYTGNGLSRIGNMIDYTRAALNPKNLEKLDRPDLIVGSSVHPLAAWAGRRLAKRYGVPFVFEVRDLWPQTLIDMGSISYNHPAAIGLRALEKSLYRSARRIVVLLPKAHEYIEAMGVSRTKVIWIPNGVDISRFPAYPPQERDDLTLMYFGAHGQANGLENLLAAMQMVETRAPDARIRLRLIGDGPLKRGLMESAARRGLKKISFEPPVPKDEIPKVAAEADAFVFNLINAPVFKYGISSNKLFDYLAAQRPILFCCASSNNPVEEARAGITLPPDEPEALAEAILKLAAMDAASRAAMGAAGRRYLEENYDMKKLAGRLAGALADSLASP